MNSMAIRINKEIESVKNDIRLLQGTLAYLESIRSGKPRRSLLLGEVPDIEEQLAEVRIAKSKRKYTRRAKPEATPPMKADLPTPQRGKLSTDDVLAVMRDIAKEGATSGQIVTELNARRPKDKVDTTTVCTVLYRMVKSSAFKDRIKKVPMKKKDRARFNAEGNFGTASFVYYCA